MRARSFEEGILEAVNLGDDADTTGAVCGQLADAFYGSGGLPDAWLEALALRETISEMADDLRSAGGCGRADASNGTWFGEVRDST